MYPSQGQKSQAIPFRYKKKHQIPPHTPLPGAKPFRFNKPAQKLPQKYATSAAKPQKRSIAPP